jgi:hypothetical protein
MRRVLLVVAAITIAAGLGVSPALGSYQKSCTPDGGAHRVYFDLNMSGRVIYGYSVKYVRNSGYTIGVHGNEYLGIGGEGYPYYASPDHATVGIFVWRDIPNYYLSNQALRIDAFIDKPNAADPMCTSTWIF